MPILACAAHCSTQIFLRLSVWVRGWIRGWWRLEALSRFGVGFIEVGPVSLEGSASGESVKRIADQQALWMEPDDGSISLAELQSTFEQS